MKPVGIEDLKEQNVNILNYLQNNSILEIVSNEQVLKILDENIPSTI